MTEAQLRAIPAFLHLPVFDESDPRSDSITSVDGTGPCRSIRECSTLREVERCLNNDRFVALGALRAGKGGEKIVVAYFGEVRQTL
jgi:hypothetical protein